MAINNALTSFGMATGSTTGAFPGLSVQKTNEIKAQSKAMSDDPFQQMLIQDDLHKSELTKQNHQNFMQDRQIGRMSLDNQTLNSKDTKTKNVSTSIKKMGALADMYRQYGYEHGKNWDSMGDEELISRFNTKNPQVKKLADAFLTGGEDSEYRLSQELGLSQSYNEKKGKEGLKDNFWKETWANIKTKANVPIDSMKKRGQRTINELGGEIYKKVLKNTVGDMIGGDSVDNLIENMTDRMVQYEVMDYQQNINERYNEKAQKNLNQDIANYYENKGYTSLLKEGDFRGFLFKSLGDAAQNWEMPIVVAASVFQPEIGLALMTTDAYARENQEAFESMINNGATYEEAQQGSVVVGLVNAAVEVTLEKLIGGVETGASDAIRRTFMKNVQEEATKKGLGRVILEGVGSQIKASGEEGLEEIVQQIVQNAAVRTVNENQGLFEGVSQAFEGGFYNPLNLLAGGSNLTQNLKQNGNQNVSENVSKNVDKNEIRQSILNGTFDPRRIMNNTQGLYSMTPTLGNLQNTEQTSNTAKVGQEKATLMEDLYSIDPTLKRRLQNNPYTAEVWQRTKRWIDQNGRPERANDVAKALIEDVADRVQEKLMEKMDEGTETGKLYAPLKNADYTVDLSELKDSIDSLLEEYGIKIEEYEGKDGKTKYDLDFSKTAIDGSEASNIRKIYNWIKDTNAPMGIKEYKDRFRATLSDMVDFNPNGRDQAGRKVADTQGDKVLKSIRSRANDLAHNQIPVLADLDKTFAEWVKMMDEVSDGLVYKDRTKKGVIRDNITQIIKNLDEPSRRQLANRLEKIMPGIREEVSAINQMPKVIDHVYNPSKLQVTIRDKAGGGIGSFFGPIGWLIGNKVGEFASEKIDAKKMEAWEKVLSETSPEGIAKLAEIQSRVENNKKLTESQKDFLNDISERLKNETDSMGLNQSQAKAKDVDFLIKNGFQELANELKSKSVDKNASNDYTTTNASSNTSSVNLSLNEEETAGTESSSSGATPQGGDQVGPTTAFSQERRSGKTPTRGSNFDISNVKQEYSDNFDKIMEGKLNIGEIGRVEGKVAFDGKERPAIFSAEIKEKIERDHGIDKANMLGTLEKPDYIIKNMNGDSNRINIIRKIPGTNNFVLLAADRSNGFFVVTNYETHNNTNNRMMGELKRLLKRGELAVDNVGDIGSVLNSESTNMQETEQAGEATKKKTSKKEANKGLDNANITDNKYYDSNVELIKKHTNGGIEDVRTIDKYKGHLKEIWDNAGPDDYVVLRHNTKSDRVDSIIDNGIQSRTTRGDTSYGEDAPGLNRAIADENLENPWEDTGYGGNEIYFRIKKKDAEKHFANKEALEFFFPFDIKPEDIVAVNRAVKVGDYQGVNSIHGLYKYIENAKNKWGMSIDELAGNENDYIKFGTDLYNKVEGNPLKTYKESKTTKPSK